MSFCLLVLENSGLPPVYETHANMLQWRETSKLLRIPDLRSFRQVCKLFATLGLDRMMEEINIVGTQNNYDQLQAKLDNPSSLESIQKNTKTLRIFTLHEMVCFINDVDPEAEKVIEDAENIRSNFVDRSFLEEAIQFPLLNKLVIKGACFMDKWLLPPVDGHVLARDHFDILDVWGGLRLDIRGRALACAANGIYKHKLTPRILQAETGCEYLADNEVRRAVRYLFRHLEHISLYLNICDDELPWGIENAGPRQILTRSQDLWAQCFESAECVREIRIAFVWGVYEIWQSTS